MTVYVSKSLAPYFRYAQYVEALNAGEESPSRKQDAKPQVAPGPPEKPSAAIPNPVKGSRHFMLAVQHRRTQRQQRRPARGESMARMMSAKPAQASPSANPLLRSLDERGRAILLGLMKATMAA